MKTSLKNLILSNPGKIFFGITSFATLYGYRRTVLNDIINDKVKILSEKEQIISSKEMEFERKLDRFQVDVSKYNKLIKQNTEIKEGITNKIKSIIIQTQKIDVEIDKIKKEYVVESIDNDKRLSLLKKFEQEILKKEELLKLDYLDKDLLIIKESLDSLEDINSNSNNEAGTGGCNLINSSNELSVWEKFDNYLSSASSTELSSIGHICLCIFVLACLFSIVSVTYGNLFVEKFNLNVRFPKLAFLIKFRSEFQHFIFFFNVFLIVLALCFAIYINFCVLYYYN